MASNKPTTMLITMNSEPKIARFLALVQKRSLSNNCSYRSSPAHSQFGSKRDSVNESAMVIRMKP